MNTITLDFIKSNSTNDSIDYSFYWKLIKRFMVDIMDAPKFQISYLRTYQGFNFVGSILVDLTLTTVSAAIEDLYKLEMTPGFLGFQIVEDPKPTE